MKHGLMRRRLRVVTALASTACGIAFSLLIVSASTGTFLAPARDRAIAASTQMTVAQAPAGLQAALQQAKLIASDPAANSYFGVSVAVLGSTAVVGASQPFSTGAAYVFVRSGSAWSQQAKLTASDAASGDNFGYPVAIVGSRVIVGAPGKSSGMGAAYVFARSGTTWAQQAKLIASDGFAGDGDYFGWSVAISGTTAIVGSRGELGYAGAVYVFTIAGTRWSQQAKLTASDGVGGDQFGWSVGISGSTAMVGAYSRNSYTGAAYAFVRSGTSWSQQAELTASDAIGSAKFGWSVAIYGSIAAIGSPWARPSGMVTGAVYLFERSGTSWSQHAELTASDTTAGDNLGASVAIFKATVVAGAPNKNSNTGAAYEFVSSGTSWAQKAQLTASDGASGDQFGTSVAVSWSTALVGAPNKNSIIGAAYVYRLPA